MHFTPSHLRVLRIFIISSLITIMACSRKTPPNKTTTEESTPVTRDNLVHASQAILLQAQQRGLQQATATWSSQLFARPEQRNDTWQRGISLGLFASTQDPEEQRKIYQSLLDEIKQAGATDISIVVRWRQDTVHSSKIYQDQGITVPDELLIQVLQDAHQRGLRTFLLPIIWLKERKMGVWRGTIAPQDENAWWKDYERFIMHYAQIAEQNQVSLLSVGSELLSMETKKERWDTLISKVRAKYSHKLTYSANWDHFEVPTFWDKLDVVGLTAYQELSKQPDPSVKELQLGWRSFTVRLNTWARENQFHYIFTEVGYPSHAKGAAYPWNYSANAAPAPNLQAKCYQSMMQQWHADPRLDGVYIWNWFGFKSLQDRGYTPRGKPAQAILERWYKESM